MYKIEGFGMDYAAFSGVEGVRSAIHFMHRSENSALVRCLANIWWLHKFISNNE
jgi:hypothetical protein